MRKIGIIGGVGPESTIDYYKRIIGHFRERGVESACPEMIIYSVDLAEFSGILETRQRERLTGWLAERIEALYRGGAEFGAIASNSPHIVFDDVQTRSPMPLISIVEETVKWAAGLGLKKPGLMGTKFTMEADFYEKAFKKRGIALAVPGQADQDHIHERLFSEIELGIIKESTRAELLAIVKRMIDRDGIDSLILGCTELPLILNRDEWGIPFLNTTAIHVESIVNYCLGRD
jgi:aspartate racemase